jgi:hypothetical protein
MRITYGLWQISEMILAAGDDAILPHTIMSNLNFLNSESPFTRENKLYPNSPFGIDL